MKYFFKDDFIQHEINESILDFPKEGLCPGIWEKHENEYVLTQKAKSALMAVVLWVQQRFNIPNMGANLTGSITSNSYGSDSDLDVHFNSPNIKKAKADDFVKVLRDAFENEFKRDFPQLCDVDGHPIEVYFQKNPFQDLMSVGCYDLINEMWLVGPDFNGMDFDPYSEYYNDDMRYVDDIIDDVRNSIMESYEKSLVLIKVKDNKFKHEIEKQFVKALSKSASLFNKLRNHRKASSQPKNEKDAMRLRASRSWKIADSSFKLLDKFGYTAILKTITTFFTEKDAKEFDSVAAAMSIVKAVDDNLTMSNIDDSEKIDESIVGTVGRYGLLATLLSIPGILPASTVQQGLNSIRSHKMLNQHNKEFQDMMTNLTKDQQMFGTRSDHQLPAAKLQNALAWSLMREAENQFKKVGRIAFESVASTILNRAGGDPNNYIDVISHPKHYSEWNNYKGGWTNDTYDMRYPKNLTNPQVATAWNACTNIACEMVFGNFKSIIGNYNMIANPGRDGMTSLQAWGYSCDIQIQDHFFGYQPDQDGWRKAGTKCPTSYNDISNDPHIIFWSRKMYTIQKGDTLEKIASANSISIDMIKLVNAGLVTDSIKEGQEIVIPFKTNKETFIQQAATRLAITKKIARDRAKMVANAKANGKKKGATSSASIAKNKNTTPTKVVVVRSGDSLTKIARENGTTIANILRKNAGLKINSVLRIGQKLNV